MFLFFNRSTYIARISGCLADLRSRIFGSFVGKISCLRASPRLFEHLKNSIIADF